jgi:hypothetical protein
MNINIDTENFTFTAILDSDTGRPLSVLYVGDDSPDEAEIKAALNGRFPGYSYEISSLSWDSTGDEIDGMPEAIAHLIETSLF